jgi:predicted alpha/beta-fold hydrolase
MSKLMFLLLNWRHDPIVDRTERAPIRDMMRVHYKCAKCGKSLGYLDEIESEKHHG